jgi:hypothetical protein
MHVRHMRGVVLLGAWLQALLRHGILYLQRNADHDPGQSLLRSNFCMSFPCAMTTLMHVASMHAWNAHCKVLDLHACMAYT